MAKGKFSHPRGEGDSNIVNRFSKALQDDETVLIHNGAQEPPPEDPDGARSMPQWDFEDLDDLDSLKELDFPELLSLDTQSEESGYQSRFAPIPPSAEETEEEKIEKAFAASVEQKRRSSSQNGILRKILIAAAAVAAILFLALGGFALYGHYSDPYDNLILKGVHAAGVDLGGMTREQAEQALASAVDPILSAKDMVASLPDQSLTLSPQDTNVSIRVGAAVKEAYNYGRTGSRQEQEQAYRNSLTQDWEVDLLPFLDLNKNYVKKQLNAYSDSHNSSYTPSSYALEGEQPPLNMRDFNENIPTQTLLLILGNPGFHLDTEKALAEIMVSYSRLDMNPKITLEAGDTVPEALDLNKIHEEYSIAPVNSSMNKDNFEVISGSYGYTFNLQAARRALSEAHYGDTVRIPMEYEEPEIMDHEVYFQDVLSVSETPHTNNEKRNENLRIACKALDGLILYPGDEFSYNATLGERTADKGYQPAPAYSGDKLVDSLGGGICQVSSTLYYGCMLADLEITDRINHGFLPSYIDPGMDATVSWGGPDFKFRNNTDFPIKLQAEVTEKKVIIKILGTDNKDYYIKMEYTMSDSAPKDVYKEFDADSGYYDGQVVSEGLPGHHVKTSRCKYSKKTDTLISKEAEARSGYLSRDRIIAVVESDEPSESEAPETSAPSTPPETEAPSVPPATEAPSEPPATEAPAPTDPPKDPPTTVPPEPPAKEPPTTVPPAPQV